MDGGVVPIIEIKQMPVCVNVTKQQCDSKWAINDQGEKVWVANENCRDVTWENCRLEDREVVENVPIKKCFDGEDETFLYPVVKEETLTSYKRECVVGGGAVCETQEVTECVDVSWIDCTEKVKTDCKPVTIHTPWQEYEHLLRCNVKH